MNKQLTPKQIASGYVLKIRALNKCMASDQFEMSRLLYALHTGNMHLDFGYENFAEFVHHELSYTYSTAIAAINMYKNAKRLKFNKAEIIDLLERVGLTRTRESLRKMSVKQTTAKIEKSYGKSSNSLTVHLTPAEMKLVEKKLLKYGLDVNQNGTRMNMRPTLLALVAAA